MAAEMRSAFSKKLDGISELNLAKGEYLIWGSGPMTVRGLRESGDIDLLVNAVCWDRLTQIYPVEGEKRNVIRLGEIEVWSDLLNLTPIIDQMIEDCDWIEGHPFMKLKYVVQWKTHFGREKDLRDVAMIEEFLRETLKT